MTTNPTVRHETQLQHAALFERNVMPFLNCLYTAATYLTADPHTAEDLVTDCLTRASRMATEESTNVKSWLYGLLIDTHGSAGPERTHGELAEANTDASLPQVTAAAKALARIPEARVKQALQQVSPTCRPVVYFADVEGYTYRQIAEIIGAPIGSVAARLHRGRRQLRALLLRQVPAERSNIRHHRSGPSPAPDNNASRIVCSGRNMGTHRAQS
jgi:RNA polymerase sigma-70 factor, ECF subfamily